MTKLFDLAHSSEYDDIGLKEVIEQMITRREDDYDSFIPYAMHIEIDKLCLILLWAIR